MPIPPKHVSFDDDSMWVTLSDGRTLGVPLAWFPRLLHATAKQRADFTLSPMGPHWDALDEDISIAGLIAGRGDMAAVGRVAQPVNNPFPKSTYPNKINPLTPITRVLPAP